MLINSLEKMEQIVENNKALSWDGWTVVENDTKNNGLTSNSGAYINGRWVVQNRYEPSSSGWEIPGKYLR
jgi:hypothetical protein